MKKLIVLIALFTTVYATNASAQQGGGDTAAMNARIRQTKAMLIEKAKITDAQAEKVMQINMDVRKAMRDMRNENLSDDERKSRVAALDADRDKKYKDIPLTEEQVKAVNDAFAEMRKQQQGQRPGNR
jgi:hypothetical protein